MDTLMALGWWVCHQDPARSIFFGQAVTPLCARCTSIYLFLGLALWAGLVAGRPRDGAGLLLAVVAAAVGSAITLAQWMGAQAGLWESTPLNRILTGMPCGAGLGVLLHAGMSLRLRSRSGRPCAARVVFALASAAVLALLVLQPPWPAVSFVLGALSLAGFFSSSAWIHAILLSFIFRRREGTPHVPAVWAVTGAAVLLEAVLMSVIRI
jgi:uncharacterized membrane protein